MTEVRPHPKPPPSKKRPPAQMKRTRLARKSEFKQQSYSRSKGARAGVTRSCAREGCDNTFYVYPSHSTRFCSRPCAYASRPAVSDEVRREKSRAMLGQRRGKKNPNYRHGRRVGVHQRERQRFVSSQTICQHPECSGTEPILNEHHVVYEQKVRRVKGDVFDGRNALRLCASCHTSHHRRGRVLPLTALRDANYTFAEELLGVAAYDYLRRRYVGDDPRLNAILDRYYTHGGT